jgi:hypothetical protein
VVQLLLSLVLLVVVFGVLGSWAIRKDRRQRQAADEV